MKPCSLHCRQACSPLHCTAGRPAHRCTALQAGLLTAALHMLQVEAHEQQPERPAYHNCQ